MDESIVERLFDYAVYLAYCGIGNPSDETILSLMSWLLYRVMSCPYVLEDIEGGIEHMEPGDG